jgi:hypothetical protein
MNKTMNIELIRLYADVLQRPVSQRYNMKALILDIVPAKRMLYQVYMSVKGFDVAQAVIELPGLPPSEVRFVNFLQGTLFTEAEVAQIKCAQAAMSANIPEQYRYRAPVQSKAFAYYGRKFGQPVVDGETIDNLYRS